MATTYTTNNIPRPLVALADIPEREREQFDYIDVSEHYYPRIFRYRGEYYDAGDIMRATGDIARAGWDGFNPDSYWSGIAIRYVADDYGDMSVIVATVTITD